MGPVTVLLLAGLFVTSFAATAGFSTLLALRLRSQWPMAIIVGTFFLFPLVLAGVHETFWILLFQHMTIACGIQWRCPAAGTSMDLKLAVVENDRDAGTKRPAARQYSVSTFLLAMTVVAILFASFAKTPRVGVYQWATESCFRHASARSRQLNN